MQKHHSIGSRALALLAALVLALTTAGTLTACSNADYEDDAIVVRSSNLTKDDEGKYILGTLHVSIENKSGSKQDVSFWYDVVDDSGEVIAAAFGGVDDLRPGMTDEEDVSIICMDTDRLDEITGGDIKSYKFSYAHHS